MIKIKYKIIFRYIQFIDITSKSVKTNFGFSEKLYCQKRAVISWMSFRYYVFVSEKKIRYFIHGQNLLKTHFRCHLDKFITSIVYIRHL